MGLPASSKPLADDEIGMLENERGAASTPCTTDAKVRRATWSVATRTLTRITEQALRHRRIIQVNARDEIDYDEMSDY